MDRPARYQGPALAIYPIGARVPGSPGFGIAANWPAVLAAALISSAVWLVAPVWFAPVIAILGVAALTAAIVFPFPTCLLFVIFSFFRVHEAFPAVYALHLPLVVGALMGATLTWHMLLSRSIRPIWSGEIKAFIVFFAIATIGVAFAINRPFAWALWSETFWKIGVTTLALAWLPSRIGDFKLAALVFVLAGAAVGLIAIHNSWVGADLVELTRVSVGRDLNSVLGDPNDLALILLFPLGFSASMIAHGRSLSVRTFAVAGLAIVLYGIILTQSRGGLIGVLAIAGVFGFRFVRSKILLAGFGLGCTLALYSAMNIAGRVSGGAAEAGVDASSMGRVHAWATALNMAAKHPLTGIGLNNFSDNYYFYTAYFDGVGRVAHSTWLGVLAETGVPGFAAFMCMVVLCFSSIIRSMRIVRRRGLGIDFDGVGTGILVALVGFSASGTFLSQGFTWPIYILLALTTGFARTVDLAIENNNDLLPAHRPGDSFDLPFQPRSAGNQNQ